MGTENKAPKDGGTKKIVGRILEAQNLEECAPECRIEKNLITTF